ncbi:MAG: DNA helicase RecQ [Alcanivorax sp.]|uniref:DNA helicase RecQ n=1 Tax=Alloalcanivorax marinus TaxID=1177169 RepID=UPI00195C7A0E|nr:DNA helicase RecQ [Alloalcanivorax marinus]MBM7333663.1 DNA helicase RecQ [Alloalcanivorax marinus]
MQRDPLSVLQHVFGYHEFRGEQAAIIDTVAGGGDALVLMPTGGGKSLCYQIPSLVRDGVGVVVSPLIALMQDQVDALNALGVRAAFLNSTLTGEQSFALQEQVRRGELDLLYVAPERLIQPRTLELLHQSPLALFAIDEAHCVSQWGHDFRSDYLQLSLLHREFPKVPRIALTATADPRTRAEIAERLDLGEARHFVSSFDRPNIQYRIERKDGARRQLLRLLRTEHPGDAGIVYCLSRNKVDQTADWLNQQGISALPYHAGLDGRTRAHHQQRFLREEGLVMVATVAFGMGIDKPDVRFVAHLDMPKSIEAYYQETGRAGRDGEPATAWMAYGLEDAIRHKQMQAQSEGGEQFKRHENQRLEAMLGLCEVTHCRRQALLHYFGEELEKPCGNCDTCLNPPKTFDATKAAQMALSCVFRTGQRFGVNHLVDVLTGNRSDKVASAGHDHVSTWNIGGEFSAGQWRAIYRQLVARGLLAVDAEGYGALKLTETCRPYLRGEQVLHLRKDTAKATERTRRDKPQVADADRTLWEALRACRKRLAEEEGVPPYVIFHDATLMDMLALRPRDRHEMAAVSGVGDRKLDAYGDAFLAVLNEGSKGPEGGAAEVRDPRRAPDGDQDELEALARAGMAPDAIARRQGLGEAEVYRALADLVADGRLDLEQALGLPPAELGIIQDALLAQPNLGDDTFSYRQVREFLSDDYPTGVLHCVRRAILASL